MTASTTVTCTLEELTEMIRHIFREETKALKQDRPLTRFQAGQLLGKTSQSIARYEKQGKIKRISPHGQPKYYESDILALKK